MRSTWGLGWVLGLLLALLSSPAAAQPTPEDSTDKRYKALLEKANKYYDVLEYEEALKLYKEAYLLQPGPGLLADIGLCYRKLGRHEEALDVYQKLAADPSIAEESRAGLQKIIEQLKETIATKEPPALVVADPDSEPTSKPAESQPASSPATVPSLPEDPPQKSPLSPLTRRLYTISLAAGALSAASAGTGLLLLMQARSRAEGEIFTGGVGSDALVGPGRALGTIADVLLAAAVGTAGAAFLRARKEKKEKNAGLRAGPLGLSLWLRY